MNLFKQLIVSLYSPKDISTFRQQRVGKTILYVLILTLLSILPSIYHFNTAMVNGMDTIKETVQKNLPPFTIENGELFSEETVPLTINKSDFTFIFDSTGTINQAKIDRANDTIFILKNELVYSASGVSQSMPYSMFGDVTITKDDLSSMLTSVDSILPITIPIVSLIVFLFSSIMKFIEVSILALFGLALKNILNKKSSYGQLWRMSAYSVTLPTLFFTIMDALKTVVPNGFFIHWLVAFIMLLLSLKEIPSEKNHLS
jgi:Protein of unknown function (DUF1189)